jgi:hypothetical protein
VARELTAMRRQAYAKNVHQANIAKKVVMHQFHVVRAFTVEQARASAHHAQRAATVQLILKHQFLVLAAAIAQSAKESVTRVQLATRVLRVHFTRWRARSGTTVLGVRQLARFVMRDLIAWKQHQPLCLAWQVLIALRDRATVMCALLGITAVKTQRYPRFATQAHTVIKVSRSVRRASVATFVKRAQ